MLTFSAIVSPFYYMHKVRWEEVRAAQRATAEAPAASRPAPAVVANNTVLPKEEKPVPANADVDAKDKKRIENLPELTEEEINLAAKAQKFQPGNIVKVEATAYCLSGATASGVRSKYGIVAADPKLLPIGSIVRLYADEYSGLYAVLDTGGAIKGRKIDIYLTSNKEAMQFGRRKVHLEVLRYGWNPQAVAPRQITPETSSPSF